MDVEDYRSDMSKEMEEDEEREKRRSMARRMIECHALTDLQREYLYLKYVKDIGVKEISVRKKCTKQAVAQVIGLAIKRLRGMYFCLPPALRPKDRVLVCSLFPLIPGLKKI